MSKPLGFSVRAIICDEDDRILLLRRHPESGSFPGQWDLPGGKCDPGETFWESLEREVREETGLAIQFVSHVGSGQFDIPNWTIVFLVLKVKLDHCDVRLSEEHVEFRWVRRKDAGVLDICPPFRRFVVPESLESALG